jgi:hypothetical protein
MVAVVGSGDVALGGLSMVKSCFSHFCTCEQPNRSRWDSVVGNLQVLQPFEYSICVLVDIRMRHPDAPYLQAGVPVNIQHDPWDSKNSG